MNRALEDPNLQANLALGLTFFLTTSLGADSVFSNIYLLPGNIHSYRSTGSPFVGDRDDAGTTVVFVKGTI